jgi:hypothetical protein
MGLCAYNDIPYRLMVTFDILPLMLKAALSSPRKRNGWA